MRPVSDWTESRTEAERWAAALRRTVGYAFARLTITRTRDSYGRTYYRVESDRA